jgi:hypothetical protein
MLTLLNELSVSKFSGVPLSTGLKKLAASGSPLFLSIAKMVAYVSRRRRQGFSSLTQFPMRTSPRLRHISESMAFNRPAKMI